MTTVTPLFERKMHVKYNLRNPENGDDMFSETLV
jgi:hypothetical protein